MIQVISSACEECSIARYVVTDNCRKCMKRSCQQACRFYALDEEQSVQELARILGGAQITDAVMDSAREMRELAIHKKAEIRQSIS